MKLVLVLLAYCLLSGSVVNKRVLLQGVPILIISHHILHGTVKELSKPIAVMRKVRSDGEAQESHYSVTAIIRKKLLFKNRPKPIVKIEQAKNEMCVGKG